MFEIKKNRILPEENVTPKKLRAKFNDTLICIFLFVTMIKEFNTNSK